MSRLIRLLHEIRACRRCAEHLPLGPRPVLQVASEARILVASQAPGRKAHASGLPFDDVSGDRLRAWMGVDRATFYDSRLIAIVPMGFCYPGSARAGDLAPRPECAAAWRAPLLAQLHSVELTLVIGRYAHDYHLRETARSLTESVAAWRRLWPEVLPLPHPSPRNQAWLKRNPWFEIDVLPALRERVAQVCAAAARD